MGTRPRWLDFLLVAVAAAALLIGVLSLLVPLLLAALVVAAVVALVLVLRRADPLALLGGVSGAAVPLLYIAWSNRGGPGQRCDLDSCTELWNPWPWAATGFAGLLVGALVFAVLRNDPRNDPGRKSAP